MPFAALSLMEFMVVILVVGTVDFLMGIRCGILIERKKNKRGGSNTHRATRL